MRPDVLVVGQITIDDVVPAEPGPWRRLIGGNALYAAAGARLWIRAGGIGLVARLGREFPLDVRGLLHAAELPDDGLRIVDEEPLAEWILYETDGQRQSMPRNPALRDPAADVMELGRRYLSHIEALSASASDIPEQWLPAAAVHLAPQVLSRHGSTCEALRELAGIVTVDPSPYYTRGLDASQLSRALPGAAGFLPSQAEVQHLLDLDSPAQVAADLHEAGFAEVVLKLGAAGVLWIAGGESCPMAIPAAPADPVDLTGAGDSFGGAYAACRAQGMPPREAVLRAAVAASLIVECSGAVEALMLDRGLALDRLDPFRKALA